MAGALHAALGAYYYFRILKTMVVDEGDPAKAAFDLPLVDRAWLVVLMVARAPFDSHRILTLSPPGAYCPYQHRQGDVEEVGGPRGGSGVTPPALSRARWRG